MQKFGFLATVFFVGIAVNIYDYVVHDIILLKLLYYKLPIMRYGVATSSAMLINDAAVPLFIVSDFVGALIFVGIFNWIHKLIQPGIKGGLLYGFASGVLINIPTWFVCSLQLNNFPLNLAISWTLAGIGWTVLAGLVTASFQRRRKSYLIEINSVNPFT